MGQLLSREDEDDYENQTSPEDHDVVHEEKEKPKRRQRAAALRSRKTKPSGQGRTRRSRATNPVSFDVNDYWNERNLSLLCIIHLFAMILQTNNPKIETGSTIAFISFNT